MFKLTFYKGYPFVYGSSNAGRITLPALCSHSLAQWETYLEQFSPQTFENDGVFYDEQREVIVSPFSAVDKSNYLRVNIDNGADYYYYFIDDIQRIPDPNGANNDAARVTISPDIFLTDFFVLNEENFFGAPSIQGIVEQTTERAHMSNIGAQPAYAVKPLYRAPQLERHDFLTQDSYNIVAFFSTETANIGAIAFDFKKPAEEIFDSWLTLVSGFSQIKSKLDIQGAPEVITNISLLNMYVIPSEWLENIIASPSATYSEYSALTASGGEIGAEMFFDASKLANMSPVIAQSVDFTPNAYHKYEIQTATKSIELDAVAGITQQFNIYIEVAPTGSDSLNIKLQVNEKIIDISDDFKADYATNTAALELSQHKQTTAINAVASVVGAVGGVIGSAASGNIFGAVSSGVAGVSELTGIYDGIKNPAIATNAGTGATAVYMYGGICIVEYKNAVNANRVEQEVLNYGYVYNSPSPISMAMQNLSIVAYGNTAYFKIIDGEIRAYGGYMPLLSSCKEISAYFSRGISFEGVI